MTNTSAPVRPAVEILPFSPERTPFFESINKAWIEDMFELEDIDREILSDPEKHIISRGGDILFASVEPHGIVGAGALKRHGPGVFELTKMGVSKDARGQKVGEALLIALLGRAAALGAEDLILLTNSDCGPAIHLYEKAGFVHSQEVSTSFGQSYCRCNVAMRLGGAKLSPAALTILNS